MNKNKREYKIHKNKKGTTMQSLQPINELLQKRMDRKNFIKHVGIGFALLTGTAGVIKAFNPATTSGRAVGAGYGSSPYGGNIDAQRAQSAKL